jgi:hypothetical protein
MSIKNTEYKVVEKDSGPLRFELLNPSGLVVATFKTREQAEASASVCNSSFEN